MVVRVGIATGKGHAANDLTNDRQMVGPILVVRLVAINVF